MILKCYAKAISSRANVMSSQCKGPYAHIVFFSSMLASKQNHNQIAINLINSDQKSSVNFAQRIKFALEIGELVTCFIRKRCFNSSSSFQHRNSPATKILNRMFEALFSSSTLSRQPGCSKTKAARQLGCYQQWY